MTALVRRLVCAFQAARAYHSARLSAAEEPLESNEAGRQGATSGSDAREWLLHPTRECHGREFCRCFSMIRREQNEQSVSIKPVLQVHGIDAEVVHLLSAEAPPCPWVFFGIEAC